MHGSSTERKEMVCDFSKLTLRAYNAEADNCVRTMKLHRLASSIERHHAHASTPARTLEWIP